MKEFRILVSSYEQEQEMVAIEDRQWKVCLSRYLSVFICQNIHSADLPLDSSTV
jgi:hypothetical protein